MRQDPNAEQLMELTLADVALGRMTEPVPYVSAEMANVHLSPRFGVEQEKQDGSVKVRPIDHFSWSGGHVGCASKLRRKEESVNGYTFPQEKMRTQTLDFLWIAMTTFVQILGELPCLFKADINAAFRRIPICKKDRWACGVAFKWLDQIFVSMHHSCPFGAIGSVHAWERSDQYCLVVGCALLVFVHRVGALLQHILKRLLNVVLFRYVDDYFGIER